MFEKINIRNYVILFAIVAISSYFGNQLKWLGNDYDQNEENDLIRKYLLTDVDNEALQKNKKPNLWIHTTYATNARKWKSFFSRNSTDLNQPYIHLTIKTIIQHCGDTFNICLIDDESFSQLIPEWNVYVSTMAEPYRHRVRDFGMALLLYNYGGMVVPNSLICFRDLGGLYAHGITGDKPFVCEQLNRVSNLKIHDKTLRFLPDSYVMGGKKGDSTLGEWVKYLNLHVNEPHFQSQDEFVGNSARWFLDAIDRGKMNLVGGENVGIKTPNREAIFLEQLMEENELNLDPMCYGVYVPADEVLKRTKYQWLAYMSLDELLKTRIILAHYLIIAKQSHGRRATKPFRVGESALDAVGVNDTMKIKYILPSDGL
jgi:hypothetical protein